MIVGKTFRFYSTWAWLFRMFILHFAFILYYLEGFSRYQPSFLLLFLTRFFCWTCLVSALNTPPSMRGIGRGANRGVTRGFFNNRGFNRGAGRGFGRGYGRGRGRGRYMNLIKYLGYLFSTYPKFSEKVISFTLRYMYVCVRIKSSLRYKYVCMRIKSTER